METITERVIPLIGLEFQVEKDIYTVKVVVLPVMLCLQVFQTLMLLDFDFLSFWCINLFFGIR